MYAYDFEGRRYDVGDKLGFLEATVEYALRREDQRYLGVLKRSGKVSKSNICLLYTSDAADEEFAV